MQCLQFKNYAPVSSIQKINHFVKYYSALYA